MAFSNGLDVAIGDPTKASHYDNLADNTEFNREKADAAHDFTISTGDGHHIADENQPLVFKNSAGTIAVSLAVHETASGGKYLLIAEDEPASLSQGDAGTGYLRMFDQSDVPA